MNLSMSTMSYDLISIACIMSDTQYIKVAAGLVVFALVIKYALQKKEGYAPYPGVLASQIAPVKPVQLTIPPSGAMTTSADLLPKPVQGWNDTFRPQNLSNMNFVDAVKFQGFDTKGSTLKNANYDIRPSIPVPKKISDWNNSSVDPDVMRRPLY